MTIISRRPDGRWSCGGILADPTWHVFAASLFLSAVAIHYAEIPNRDGMLYIDTARIFLEKGLAAAYVNFDWIFFPICIALTAKITGLGLEASAYFLNALLFAGTCGTLVRIVHAQFPSVIWYACLIVLSLPRFNEQRSEIIREIGCWFFCLQALLATLRWRQAPCLRRGLAVQSLLAAACLFRVESVVFFFSLLLWQTLDRQSWRQCIRRLATLLCLPMVVGLTIAGLLVCGWVDLSDRVANYVAAANPVVSLEKFRAVAGQFRSALPNDYVSGEAGSILFFGLLGIVIKKFIHNNGILLIPFAVFFWHRHWRRELSAWQPQMQFFVVYALVLVAFAMYNLFMSSRYEVFLNILTIPLIAVGLKEMFETWPRWRAVFVACLMVTALANVVSLSPKKTQYRQAGQWLAAHPEISTEAYIDDPRVRYFAGHAVKIDGRDKLEPEEIENALGSGKFEYVVVSMARDDAAKAEWIGLPDIEEMMRFPNEAGDAIAIFRRKRKS
jgi:hypothetical protein